MKYESTLPYAEPLTGEESAKLLTQLGEIQRQLLDGHTRLIQKCVWRSIRHLRAIGMEIDPSDLEMAAQEALWIAIQKARPREPGFFPFTYFEKWIKGALKRAIAKERKHRARSRIIDWENLPWRQDSNALREALHQLNRELPDLAEVVLAKLAGTKFSKLARELGVPASTLRSRYQRGVDRLREIMSSKS